MALERLDDRDWQVQGGPTLYFFLKSKQVLLLSGLRAGAWREKTSQTDMQLDHNSKFHVWLNPVWLPNAKRQVPLALLFPKGRKTFPFLRKTCPARMAEPVQGS